MAATAPLRALEETGGHREALVVGQRQLVAGSLGCLQPRARAMVTMATRTMMGELLGCRAITSPGNRYILGPGLPGWGSLPPQPLECVCGVCLQREDVWGFAIAVPSGADGTLSPAPGERNREVKNTITWCSWEIRSSKDKAEETKRRIGGLGS